MELLFCSCVSFSHTFLQCYSHTTIPFRKENQYQDTTQDTRLRTTIPTTEKKIEIKMLQLFPSTTTLFDGRWFYPITHHINAIAKSNSHIVPFLLLHTTLLPYYVVCCIILVITISRLSESGIIAPPWPVKRMKKERQI